MAIDPTILRHEIDETQSGPTIPDRPDWEKFASTIKGMLVGDEYEYAEGTLRGILETVQRTQNVTPGQEDAIQHIAWNPGRASSPRGALKRRWDRE